VTDSKGLRILSLQAENIKRLIAVEITPHSDVVVISGKNAQGKSSVLDAIWWALEGASNIQSVPIRRGANEARIRLDLGEIIVTRRFKKDSKGEVTTGVVVESAKGARFTGPQKMLDELIGSLSMDPVAFDRLGATPEGKRQQLKELQVFVPGYNFDEQDGLNKADNERRAEVNKLVLQSKAAADLVCVPEDTPDEEEDEALLVLALENAGKANALNATRRERRTASEASLKAMKESLGMTAGKLAVLISDADRECREAVERLRKEIERVETAHAASVVRLKDESAQEAANLATGIADIEARFASADPIPDDTDTDVIRANIAAARKVNIDVRKKQERARHVVLHDRYKAEADGLTAGMLARQAAKRAAIAAAQMPVPGLDFGVSEILLNGLPFDQASDAERLRASIDIAIAQNPKLRVLRIRDGSLLDSDGMKLVEQKAADHGFQVWIEVVSDGEPIGFVIEAGELKD
jgi:ABC-type cobalamin/Fe3+-siderophores transport system ATPase subunit